MRVRWFAWVGVAAAGFALCQLPSAPPRLTPDSTEYLVQTLHLLGDSPAEARERTIRAFCSGHRADRPLLPLAWNGPVDTTAGRAQEAACADRLRREGQLPSDTRYGPAMNDSGPIVSGRYEAIFLARPGAAVLFAPGVALAGPVWGMWLTVLLCALVGGALTAVVLRLLGLATPLVLLGEVLYFALPTGKWSMYPLTEAPTLALVVLALLGSVIAVKGRVALGSTLLAGAFTAGFFLKYSQFLLLGLGLAAGASAALVFFRQTRHRGTVAVALTCAVAAVSQLLLARWLGWPGSTETMQDLLTQRYTRPDVPDPYYQWLRRNGYFWSWWLGQQLLAPLLLLSWAASGWALVRTRSVFGFLVIGVAAAGLANQAGHPNALQGDRLYVLAWVLVVFGLPILLDQLRRSLAPRPSIKETAAEPPARDLLDQRS